MVNKINNNNLYIAVDTCGASLRSLCDLHGTEYLWQSKNNGSNLSVPIIFGDGENTISENFKLINKTSSELSLSYTHKNTGLSLKVVYSLMENTLNISFLVKNETNENKVYTIGAKPCFFVPIDEDESFSDYLLKLNDQNFLFKDFKENITNLNINTNTLILYSLQSGKGVKLGSENISANSLITLKTDELLCINFNENGEVKANGFQEHNIKITII